MQCPSKVTRSTVRVPPHGVCDTHGGTKEGGEAEESDEDGGHLADSVWLSGSLTVHHHTALWGNKKHRPKSEVITSIPTVRSVRMRQRNLTKLEDS